MRHGNQAARDRGQRGYNMSDSHPSKAPNCANILYFGRHRICSEDLVQGLWLAEWRARRRRERARVRWSWLLRILGVE